MSGAPARLSLAHVPTPLVRHAALCELAGVDLWIKRDDATGGAEAGNKVRKLEFLLADAQRLGCDTVLTCGGLQSNHARATALCAAGLGMRATLFLRTPEPESEPALTGNVLLDRLAGAEIRRITPAQYRDRAALLEAAAEELRAEGRRPYVIPEGGSNGLGALGYVEAMREVRGQLDLGLAGGRPFDMIVVACGSGGTAAGVALGAARFEVAAEVRAVIVCDDVPYFEATIERIMREAASLDPRLHRAAHLTIDDGSRGPAYAVATAEQRALLGEVARRSGVVLDPVYTGKAFHGLCEAVRRDARLRGERVLFLHTGGLPGLLAQGEAFA